jgi:hypothetical protein
LLDTDYSYGDIPDIMQLVQHEFSHAYHDEFTGLISPAGLWMASVHNVNMETNRWIAFTEGFADFMPLAINNPAGNRFEPSSPDGRMGASINPIPLPDSGDLPATIGLWKAK